MGDKIKLLIADDEVKFLESLAKRLEIRGFYVAKASDGRQALQYASKERFDLALIDLKMPIIDGKQVLRYIKEHNISVEVIIMTGHGSEELAEECLKIGAFGYIPKPYEFDKIIEILKTAYAAHLKEKHRTNHALIEQLSAFEKEADPLNALLGMRKLVE
jgi:DNA-binding NtrC family response regulator